MLLLLIDVRKKVSKIAENKPSNMSIVCVCAKYPHWATNFSWIHFHEKISWKWFVIYKLAAHCFAPQSLKSKSTFLRFINGATYNFCTIFPFLAHCGVCANYPGMWMDKNLFLLPLLCNVTTQIFFWTIKIFFREVLDAHHDKALFEFSATLLQKSLQKKSTFIIG